MAEMADTRARLLLGAWAHSPFSKRLTRQMRYLGHRPHLLAAWLAAAVPAAGLGAQASDTVTVSLNVEVYCNMEVHCGLRDQLLAALRDASHARGYIAIQPLGEPVDFRIMVLGQAGYAGGVHSGYSITVGVFEHCYRRPGRSFAEIAPNISAAIRRATAEKPHRRPMFELELHDLTRECYHQRSRRILERGPSASWADEVNAWMVEWDESFFIPYRRAY